MCISSHITVASTRISDTDKEIKCYQTSNLLYFAIPIPYEGLTKTIKGKQPQSLDPGVFSLSSLLSFFYGEELWIL